MKQIYSITAIFIFCSMGRLNAQQVFSSAGGIAKESETAISYTIGQVFFSSGSESSGSVIPGVHQPFVITEVTGANESYTTGIGCSVFPNPTTDNLSISLKDEQFETGNLSVGLYNINGTLIKSLELISDKTDLDLCGLPPATYILRVIHDNQVIKTFQVIKN